MEQPERQADHQARRGPGSKEEGGLGVGDSDQMCPKLINSEITWRIDQ